MFAAGTQRLVAEPPVRASGGLSAGAERLRPLRCGDPDLQFAVRRQLVARDQALEPWSPPQWRIEGIDAQQRKRDRGREIGRASCREREEIAVGDGRCTE